MSCLSMASAPSWFHTFFVVSVHSQKTRNPPGMGVRKSRCTCLVTGLPLFLLLLLQRTPKRDIIFNLMKVEEEEEEEADWSTVIDHVPDNDVESEWS